MSYNLFEINNMKTRDSISKKRQKLRDEIDYWEAREREARAGIALTPEVGASRAAAVIFCRQESAKRTAAMKKLATGSRWQELNGWK